MNHSLEPIATAAGWTLWLQISCSLVLGTIREFKMPQMNDKDGFLKVNDGHI
jgi:hypothetical protein